MLIQMGASAELKSFCILCLLLLNLLQIVLLRLLWGREERKKFYINLILAIVVFLAISFIGEHISEEDVILKNFPILCSCIFVLISVIYIVRELVIEIQTVKNRLTVNAVKESFDTLPVGICFFSEQGIPVLCNKKMYEIAYFLMGKDLQTLYELEIALENPAENVETFYMGDNRVYRLENGKIGSFTKKEIKDKNGRRYIQIITTDLTELYKLQTELDLRNNELQKMIERVQRIAENMADITRQQEILTAKMRVHNKMGNSLLAVRRYVMQGSIEEQKEKVLEIWSDTLKELYNEIGQQDEPDVFEEVVRIGNTMGVTITVRGDIPENQIIQQLLLVSLRECLTNTVKHAEGNQLLLQLTTKEGKVQAVYSNNGKQPEKDIVEGGGLSSLREKIEQAEGSMMIRRNPRFELIIELPEEGAELW